MVDLPALLLLHGVGDAGECWAPFLSALDLPDLVVETPSAAAHGGRKAAPGHDFSGPDMVAEAVALAERMAAAAPAGLVIGGHSMGASISVAVAAARPDLFRGLFLEDPPFSDAAGDLERDDTTRPVPLTDLHQWLGGLQRGTLSDALAAARADHPNWDDAEFEPWARAKLGVDLSALARPKPWVVSGWTRHAQGVACPALVIAGDPSRGSLTSPDAEVFLTGLANWEIHRAEQAGHDVRRDARAQTVGLLRGFLDRLITQLP
ncbi:MAG: alpha/beta fold hydrolase [Candidatus Nanopelagicales bacterium]